MEFTTEEKILYSDKLIEIRENATIFRNYYFPTLSNKTVMFHEIEKIILNKPSLKNGKFRYWGTGDFIHWFPLDNQRNKREVIYILFRQKKRIRIGFTVENSQKVTGFLKEKVIIHNDNN